MKEEAKATLTLSRSALDWLRVVIEDMALAPVQDSFTAHPAKSEIRTAVLNAQHTFDNFDHQLFATSPSWCRNCGRVFRGPITPNVEAICDCSGEKGAA